MQTVINTLIGFVLIGALWLIVSYLAYHFSVVIKKAWPLGIICAVSMVFSWLYSLYLFFWYLLTTFTIFKEGSILLAILFFFVLGGIITGILSALVNFVAMIPLSFMDKFETRLQENDIIDL